MKKTIIAFAFAIFSTAVPLLMAKAVAQEADLVAMEAEPTSNVRIEIDGMDADREDQIRETLEGLSEVFGDRFKAELDVELSELSSSERDRLERALDRLADGTGIQLGGRDGVTFHGGSIGFGEVIIALTAISLTLGLPVIILLMVFIYAQKKRRQMMDLAGMYIQADKPMPPHVMTEFGTGMSADKRLRSGIQMLLLGIAITAILGTFADEAAVLGLIPIAIGLARILYWRYETKSGPAQQEDFPELPAE